MKKHIVILSVFFPPEISIASNRIFAFAKYLQQDFFKITVITVHSDLPFEKPTSIDHVRIIRLNNDQFLKRIRFSTGDNFLVHKLKSAINKIFNFMVPDEYSNWTKKAAELLISIHQEDNIDFILSSYAPIAPHLVVLKANLPCKEIKWIADMRDEMSANPYIAHRQKKFFAKVEQEIFSKAWLLTSTSDSFINIFRHLDKNGKINYLQVKNGFDFELPDKYNFNEVFTMTHTGTFYGEIKPHHFFKALLQLIEENRITEFVINFIGAGAGLFIPFKLKDRVTVTERIAHGDAVRYILDSDANLLFLPSTRSGAIPGKLYEYLASLKPVIAMADKKEQSAEIIKRAGAGFTAGFDNIPEIREIILKAYTLWKDKRRIEIDINYIKQFHRRTQVLLLQNMLLNRSTEAV